MVRGRGPWAVARGPWSVVRTDRGSGLGARGSGLGARGSGLGRKRSLAAASFPTTWEAPRGRPVLAMQRRHLSQRANLRSDRTQSILRWAPPNANRDGRSPTSGTSRSPARRTPGAARPGCSPRSGRGQAHLQLVTPNTKLIANGAVHLLDRACRACPRRGRGESSLHRQRCRARGRVRRSHAAHRAPRAERLSARPRAAFHATTDPASAEPPVERPAVRPRIRSAW